LPQSVFWLAKWHPDSFVIRGVCRLEEDLLKKLCYVKVDLYKEIFKQYSAFV